ncbi:MAG: ABC transporter ATP-binding protein [Alphaproteobacteria bacterium]|nr:MAG: ABC transporter ATP-binding protein [Alphaproteobacteria bacterium]
MNKILKIQNLTKNFGNVSAVSNVSIEVEEGTIHSIIGPNGAGKSTFFNMISGVIPPSEGNVYYKDKDITGFESYKLPHMGIAKCFQITNVFPKLTVRENVWASIFSCSHKSKIDLFKSMNDFETIDKETKKIITDVGLSHKIDDKAEELSHGQQRMLEMAITLGAKPDLLLLDEPTQGLAPEATVEMTELIRKLSKKYTILLIEHKMHIVMEISKIITVLNFGEKIEEGTPNQIKNSKKVQDAYLGRK